MHRPRPFPLNNRPIPSNDNYTQKNQNIFSLHKPHWWLFVILFDISIYAHVWYVCACVCSWATGKTIVHGSHVYIHKFNDLWRQTWLSAKGTTTQNPKTPSHSGPASHSVFLYISSFAREAHKILKFYDSSQMVHHAPLHSRPLYLPSYEYKLKHTLWIFLRGRTTPHLFMFRVDIGSSPGCLSFVGDGIEPSSYRIVGIHFVWQYSDYGLMVCACWNVYLKHLAYLFLFSIVFIMLIYTHLVWSNDIIDHSNIPIEQTYIGGKLPFSRLGFCYYSDKYLNCSNNVKPYAFKHVSTIFNNRP